MSIEKILDLSTVHMSSSNPEFGDIRAQAHDYGFIVWVRDVSGDDDEKLADWFLPILKEAQRCECTLILFDQDAEIHEGLPTFDW